MQLKQNAREVGRRRGQVLETQTEKEKTCGEMVEMLDGLPPCLVDLWVGPIDLIKWILSCQVRIPLR